MKLSSLSIISVPVGTLDFSISSPPALEDSHLAGTSIERSLEAQGLRLGGTVNLLLSGTVSGLDT